MKSGRRFLVVDFHAESRFLLVRTLLRKFPDALVHEFDEAEEALAMVARRGLSAVILHRTFDVSGVDLIRQIRAVDHFIPVVMVSGIDREEAALAAGADRFLHYDQWLCLGSLVKSLLSGVPIEEPARDPVG